MHHTLPLGEVVLGCEIELVLLKAGCDVLVGPTFGQRDVAEQQGAQVAFVDSGLSN